MEKREEEEEEEEKEKTIDPFYCGHNSFKGHNFYLMATRYY